MPLASVPENSILPPPEFLALTKVIRLKEQQYAAIMHAKAEVSRLRIALAAGNAKLRAQIKAITDQCKSGDSKALAALGPLGEVDVGSMAPLGLHAAFEAEISKAEAEEMRLGTEIELLARQIDRLKLETFAKQFAQQ